MSARTADGAVVSLHTSWVARFGAGWRLAVHGSEGALLAEAGGHTGHFPVRLSGARGGDDGLRELVPAVGTATEPFAALVRAIAAGQLADVPTASTTTSSPSRCRVRCRPPTTGSSTWRGRARPGRWW
jgi:predicted dehydrogenase